MPNVRPTPITKQVIVDNSVCYSIADTAKMLGTNTTKVRQLMGSGQLDFRQTRLNSKRLYVTGESINRFKYPKPDAG